ncbi:hypothetical protein [Candidatus Phytoplasma oryzae]|nr:hypothetical protein [Candidatus Phytoplasma oryzae]
MKKNEKFKNQEKKFILISESNFFDLNKVYDSNNKENDLKNKVETQLRLATFDYSAEVMIIKNPIFPNLSCKNKIKKKMTFNKILYKNDDNLLEN